jgi:hypothetical protein
MQIDHYIKIANYFLYNNFYFWFSLLFSFFAYIRYTTRNRFLLGLFFLPSTFFHEFAHFFIGLITFAKPVHFSLFPKNEGNTLRLGEVKFANLNFFNSIPTALAPILLLVGLYYFDLYFAAYIKANILNLVLFIYVNFIFTSGGIPSSQDFKVAFSNVLGVVFWIIVLILVFLIKSNYIKLEGIL